VTTPARIITAVIVAILIAAAGMATGYFFKKENISIEMPEIAVPKISETISPEKTSINNTVYDVSPPSRGPAIEVFSVDITPVDNKAEIQVDSSRTMGKIQPGQYVLLYKADGSLLEILGETTEVVDTRDGKTLIRMNLNGDTAVSSDDAIRGDIILSSMKDAQRLPLSTIVNDKDGKPHIWEVLSKDDAQFARYKPANILARTYNFVTVEQPDSVSNVYILNPDANLRDGQKISTRKMLYAAPYKTEESVVTDAIEYRKPREQGEDPYKGKAKSTCGLAGGNGPGAPAAGAGCGQQAGAQTGACGGGSSACGGGSRDVIQDFIQKIRANSGTPPAAPSAP